MGEPDRRGHAEKSSAITESPSTFGSFGALMEWAKGKTSSPSAPLICIILPMEMGIGCSAETFLEA